jgi:hypothetical protein
VVKKIASQMCISQPEKKKQKYTPWRTLEQKIADFFDLLKTVDWSLAECVYYLFTHADIIHAWLHSKDGCLHCDLDLMFSLDTAYTEIKLVRPCLTLFAAQMVSKKLVSEVKEAVLPPGQLWTVVSRKSSLKLKQAEWADIGATIVADVAATFQAVQPLTWQINSIQYLTNTFDLNLIRLIW